MLIKFPPSYKSLPPSLIPTVLTSIGNPKLPGTPRRSNFTTFLLGLENKPPTHTSSIPKYFIWVTPKSKEVEVLNELSNVPSVFNLQIFRLDINSPSVTTERLLKNPPTNILSSSCVSIAYTPRGNQLISPPGSPDIFPSNTSKTELKLASNPENPPLPLDFRRIKSLHIL